MPIFTPSRRWQKPYLPFKSRSISERVEESFERALKGTLWGCRMCGNCLLQETAFICPMACPKGLRNGPCGGSTPDHCCVDDSRPCIWHAIFTRAEKMGRMERLLEIMPPLDWDKTGTSALRDVYEKISEHGMGKTIMTVITSPNEGRKDKWERFFYEIRQPAWWNGDTQPHPPLPHTPVSTLETRLAAGQFVLTCELVPPLAGNFSALDEKITALSGLVDAVNITDNASAIPRVSSFACAQRAIALGVEPVLQMAARDRTRISFQADLLGAAAAGIHNVLLITGDHPNKGIQPYSKMDIWDFDSIQAIWMARQLRDDGIFLDGRRVDQPPSYFIGAAAAPFASEPGYQALRAEKKINAGAQFLQTNLVFDIDHFLTYLEALDRRNLLDRVHLIPGIAPIKSLKAANYLRQLPGVVIPDEIMTRLGSTSDISQESHQISLEIIEKLRALPGVHGLHFMANGNLQSLQRLMEDSGLRD